MVNLQEYLPLLEKVPLFDRIKEIGAMLGCLGAYGKAYKREEFLLLRGEPVHEAGIVLSGRVHIVKEDENGGRIILNELDAGDIFAESLASAQVRQSPVSVVAVQPCAVLWMDIGKITTVCGNQCDFHGRLIRNLLKLLAQRNLFLNSRIDILSMRTTREKLLAFLQSASGGKKTFQIPFNRTELADFLGADRSAMTRELSRMRADGLVEFDKNEFTLKDR